LEIAAQRYRIIAEAAKMEGTGVTAEIEAAAKREYRGVDGQILVVTSRTLWRWLEQYRQGGLNALKPKARSDAGKMRVLNDQVLERATALRRSNNERPTRTIIDILERTKWVEPGEVKRSTLDRYLDREGLSRRRLHRLGKTTYRQIETLAPLELVIADFHHGPYVRVENLDHGRRALLLAFLDHFSRDVLHGRYYLHEDFAVLHFGFRSVLLVHGLFDTLYVDNGPSFQTTRFHAACKNEALDIKVVHSKPYVSEGRGVCERFNRTVKEQFESEVRNQEDLLTLRAGARSAVPGGAPARLRRGSAWTNPGTGGPVCAKRLRRAVVGTVLRLLRASDSAGLAAKATESLQAVACLGAFTAA
jgi:transposase InsO family protein